MIISKCVCDKCGCDIEEPKETPRLVIQKYKRTDKVTAPPSWHHEKVINLCPKCWEEFEKNYLGYTIM